VQCAADAAADAADAADDGTHHVPNAAADAADARPEPAGDVLRRRQLPPERRERVHAVRCGTPSP
jgi:hypothetical protein